MRRGEFEDAGERMPAELQQSYENRLVAVVEDVGVDRVVEETDLDRETVQALLDGASPDIELTDAAAIIALDEDAPPADAVEAEARDILLMGMTTASPRRGRPSSSPSTRCRGPPLRPRLRAVRPRRAR